MEDDLSSKRQVTETGECLRMEKKGRYVRPIYKKDISYPEEKVKEFIRLLKEFEDCFDLQSAEALQFRKAIQAKRDKLAGEELI